MTVRFTAEEPDPKSPVSVTEELYGVVADEVWAAIRKLKAGELDPKGTAQSVRDMRAVLQLVLEERSKVAKLAKLESGASGGKALDFDAARAEIGRRLACLRDAGGG